MKKFVLVFVVLIFLCIPDFIFSNTYINKNQNSIIAGNDFYEIKFQINNDKLNWKYFLNKNNNSTVYLSGDIFDIEVSYLGDYITPPKITPAHLTINNLVLSEYKIEENKNIRFIFFNDGLEVNVIFDVSGNSPYFRFYYELKDVWQGSIFIEKLKLLSTTVPEQNFKYGGLGQPVYGRDFFIGIEHPGSFSEIKENKIESWHFVGEKLDHNSYYKSHNCIVGVSKENFVQQDFFNYIKSIRPNPTKIFTLYNTCYDIRDFNFEKIDKTITNFYNTYIDKYNLKLDAFVIDDGWDDLNSVWEIDKNRFPDGFSPVAKHLNKINSNLGLWISPWNGYDRSAKKRIEWAKNNEFELSGNHLCIGDDNYYKIFKQKTLDHLKDGNLSFYKIDGFLSVCNETNHDHLPGIYSREFLVNRFIEYLKKIRVQKPDIFIDITVGTWLSPWWLMYADAVWMTGADFGHAEDVPAFSERDKAITFRDYTLYKDFVRDKIQFPLANVMTHGIIKGKLNLLGGKDETLRNWQDNTAMYFSRGVMMWELYISPEVLSTDEWNFMASMMRWGYENENILNNSRFVGGDPYQREVYGYFHEHDEKSIFVIRNPFVIPKQNNFSISQLFQQTEETDYVVHQIYPQEMYYADLFSRESDLNIDLEGYEAKVIELIPESKFDAPLIAGLYLEKQQNKKNSVSYDVYTDPFIANCGNLIGEEKISSIKLNNTELTTDEFRRFFCKQNKFNNRKIDSEVKISKLESNKISGSFSLNDSLKLFDGRIGILLDFKEKIDSINVQIENSNDVLVKKGAEGLWYWIMIPFQNNNLNFSFTINIPEKSKIPKGEFSIWALGEVKLTKIGNLAIYSKKKISIKKNKLSLISGTKRISKKLFSGNIE